MHPLAPTTTKLSKSKLADFQMPDWHWGKRANPASGLEGQKLTQMPVRGYHHQMPGLTLDKDNFTRLLIAQRVISRQEAASCYGQKDWMMRMLMSTVAHLASVPIRYLGQERWKYSNNRVDRQWIPDTFTAWVLTKSMHVERQQCTKPAWLEA
ncbi:hypothetical protein LF294_001725 [Salmonella enterica]|nr:hypothetical protein [Salmonella enterica]